MTQSQFAKAARSVVKQGNRRHRCARCMHFAKGNSNHGTCPNLRDRSQGAVLRFPAVPGFLDVKIVGKSHSNAPKTCSGDAHKPPTCREMLGSFVEVPGEPLRCPRMTLPLGTYLASSEMAAFTALPKAGKCPGPVYRSHHPATEGQPAVSAIGSTQCTRY